MSIDSKRIAARLGAFSSREGMLLFLLPFVLLLLNPGLFVSNAFHSKVDSWIYYGYFRNLPQHLVLFTDFHSYFGDRLAFIIPGYLANRIFPPVIADFVLHLAYYYAATIALYSLLKLTLDRTSAFFTTLLFGAYYYNLWMFSWNYVDGAVTVYFLLTMLFFTRAGLGLRRNTSAALSGVFFACMIYSSSHSLKLAPGMGLYFVALLYFSAKEQEQSWAGVFKVIAWCAMGTLGSNIFFSGINYFLTGDFHVFRQTFAFAQWLYGEYQVPRSITLDDLSRAYWLILPLLVLVTFPVLVLYRVILKRGGVNRFTILYWGTFVALLLPFYFTKIKSSQHGIFLVASCQFSSVNGGLFLAVGALASLLVAKLGRVQFAVVTSICFLTFMAPVAYLGPQQRGQPKGPAIIARVLSVIREIDPDGRIRFIFNGPDKDLANRCGDPNFMIAGSQEDLTELYHNIASTYLWAQEQRLLSDDVTKITNEWTLTDLRRGDKIVVLTDDDREVLLAQKTLGQTGIPTRLFSERLIVEKGIAFKMVFLEIR